MTDGRHLDLPRGFHDTSPQRMAVYRVLQQEWFDTCELAAYQPVCVPPLGFVDTFTAGHHAAGQKLYRFPDRRGRDLALVSDSLPALLRMARTRDLPEQRLSYCCPIFRYERRPLRHFHHLGLIEVLDRPSPLAQRRRSVARLAEVITRFLVPRLPVTFTVTDPGLWHTIAAMVPASGPPTGFLDMLRRLPPEQRPARLREHQAPTELIRLAELLAVDPALPNGAIYHRAASLSYALRDRINACHELTAALRSHGADATVDLGELHASEFHDGPAFLVRPCHERRLLGDGGSYGLFATTFIGSPTTVHSAVIGLERLADLVTAEDTSQPAADVAVLAQPDQPTLAHADHLVASLRSAGIAVWDAVLTKPLRQHLRDLAGLAIPHSVIIGTKELDGHEYTLRALDGTLHTITQHHVAQWLLEHRPVRSAGTPSHGRDTLSSGSPLT